MISVVRVDLFLFSNASDAAFLSKADPAMQPNTVGFFGLHVKRVSCKTLQGICIRQMRSKEKTMFKF